MNATDRAKLDRIIALDLAQEWLSRGFTEAEIVAWMSEAHVHFAVAAEELREAGYTPDQLSSTYGQPETVGYSYANGEITLDQVDELCVDRSTPRW